MDSDAALGRTVQGQGLIKQLLSQSSGFYLRLIVNVAVDVSSVAEVRFFELEDTCSGIEEATGRIESVLDENRARFEGFGHVLLNDEHHVLVALADVVMLISYDNLHIIRHCFLGVESLYDRFDDTTLTSCALGR